MIVPGFETKLVIKLLLLYYLLLSKESGHIALSWQVIGVVLLNVTIMKSLFF